MTHTRFKLRGGREYAREDQKRGIVVNIIPTLRITAWKLGRFRYIKLSLHFINCWCGVSLTYVAKVKP